MRGVPEPKVRGEVVADIDEALKHIGKYSTRHSEAIVSRDKGSVNVFWRRSMRRPSIRMPRRGSPTGRNLGWGGDRYFHAEAACPGPFALEKLVTEKWVIRGTGQIRE